MLVADGLTAFLSEPAIVDLFLTVTDHFRTGEFAFNDYGRIGWVSRAALSLFRKAPRRPSPTRGSPTRASRKSGIRG